MHHPPPAAAAGGAAGRPGVLTRAQIGMAAAAAAFALFAFTLEPATFPDIGMAAAAAAFALFAFTLEPATFPDLPPQCSTSAREIMELRYPACLLLLCATAQAGAATAALVVVPPSRAGHFLAYFTNVLGLLTLGHLAHVVLRALFATGVLCLTDILRTVELTVYAVLAYMLIFAIPFLGQ